MNVLVIGSEHRAIINAAIAKARANPLKLEKAKELAALVPQDKYDINFGDRPPDIERPLATTVLLPLDYRVALMFEEQPLGLVRHISISVSTPERLPSLESCELILDMFGIGKPLLHAWVEEFEPGRRAVNFLKLDSECPREPDFTIDLDAPPAEPAKTEPPGEPSAGHPSPRQKGAPEAPAPAEPRRPTSGG